MSSEYRRMRSLLLLTSEQLVKKDAVIKNYREILSSSANALRDSVFTCCVCGEFYRMCAAAHFDFDCESESVNGCTIYCQACYSQD